LERNIVPRKGSKVRFLLESGSVPETERGLVGREQREGL
jgi:hypothetical protein